MKISALATTLLLAGCGVAGVDPCANQSGACLSVDVLGDIGPIDTITLELRGAVTHTVMARPNRAPTPLPVAVGVLLPDATGAVDLAGSGLLGSTLAGVGKSYVEGLAPGVHVRATITLSRASGTTCTDWIRNGDESAIDCGGSCPPCGPDADSDGDPDATDCRPNDPKIHHPSTADPGPESANCCGYSLGKTGPDASRDFAMDPLCHAMTCGDGIDQDCDGKDLPCVSDRDCDGFPAAANQPMGCAAPTANPPGTDCDDCDAKVNPLASEICDGKDNNCNGTVDEVCVGCDLDGDGYQRLDPKSNCPDPKTDKHPGKVDCNDEDAGVFPDSTSAPTRVPQLGTASCMGAEGGSVACALRGACRNKSPDGMPQDADCDAKPQNGCPPPLMDTDGDGFPAPADCNDKDPTIFPGAPDRCGDMVAQNCVADAPCATDADKDGYDATVDCDDSDPVVHPWAVELCNGKDDDCDGLVDEGNPDALGTPMVKNGATLSCTDSNLGTCASPPGRCVCSSASVAALQFNQTMRAACPGENAAIDTGTNATAAAPRCYFAAQPAPELCNGTDDACNGSIPANEQDQDGDGYLACGPCVPPVAGNKQCGDCQDAPGMTLKVLNSAIHPGAPDTCDGVDNDCSMATKDGATDCPGASPGLTCCGGSGCRNTSNDLNNCLGCGIVCNFPNANAMCNMNNGCRMTGCKAGFSDCDGNINNGCEVATSGDVNNCGACGRTCSNTNVTMRVCSNGICTSPCAPNFTDCDNNKQTNGCEANLQTSTQHCGGCNMPCSMNHIAATCVAGMCGGACAANYADCNGNKRSDGCEAALLTDAANCGGCGSSCAADNDGHLCIAGACGCNAAADCDANTADNCTAAVCTCGANPACDPATEGCSAGVCLKVAGEPCALSAECLSNNCSGMVCI